MNCPKCKAEIDSDSYYCDQCGQEIRYCQSCHRPGKGNRCTACGGRMLSAVEYFHQPSFAPMVTPIASGVGGAEPIVESSTTLKAPTSTRLLLANGLLGISLEGVDGAVLGRRQGIYQSQLARFPYVSGAHAQLKFEALQNHWTVTDMNSSNGTRYNGEPLSPGVPCRLEQGATLQLANVLLTVTIQ